MCPKGSSNGTDRKRYPPIPAARNGKISIPRGWHEPWPGGHVYRRFDPFRAGARSVQIRAGYDIIYDCPQPPPMLLVLSVHPSRLQDVLTPHQIVFDPPIGAGEYRDVFGNICHRIVAPPGRLQISTRFLVGDPGTSDAVAG